MKSILYPALFNRNDKALVYENMLCDPQKQTKPIQGQGMDRKTSQKQGLHNVFIKNSKNINFLAFFCSSLNLLNLRFCEWSRLKFDTPFNNLLLKSVSHKQKELKTNMINSKYCGSTIWLPWPQKCNFISYLSTREIHKILIL